MKFDYELNFMHTYNNKNSDQSRPRKLQFFLQCACIFRPQKFDVIFINPLFTRIGHFAYLAKVVTVELEQRHAFRQLIGFLRQTLEHIGWESKIDT